MNEEQVLALKRGDKVYWNDPDDGFTSRYITIQSVKTQGEVVCIYGIDGDELECFAEELSY